MVKPIGPLMQEHRLIERMVTLLTRELQRMEKDGKVHLKFLDVAVDFVRTYADRTHHGKEEDILFRELAKKQLSDEHTKIMNELVEEHVSGRKIVTNLVDAKESYVRGNMQSFEDIVVFLKELIQFYPAHIEKEDRHFFYPVLEYLSEYEQEDMLKEFYEFDRRLIHEKYEKIAKEMEIERA